MLWVTVHNHCRVPPFGYLRVTGCLHLSVAYRSLPRPSSADIAKASTVRPYYLYLFCVIICAYRRRLTLDFALRTKVRGSFISLRLLDMHQMLTKISWLNTWEIILTCIRYIVVFCSRTFSCTSPLSQRIISYVLGSTYLEILRDDLTNIYNYLLCSFQRTNNSISQTRCQILNGGDEEIRTPDPLLARQVLSQLSYAPVMGSLKSR